MHTCPSGLRGLGVRITRSRRFESFSMQKGSTENNLISFKVKHLLLRAGEVSSILTSDRLERVTSLKNHGLLLPIERSNNRKLTSRY